MRSRRSVRSVSLVVALLAIVSTVALPLDLPQSDMDDTLDHLPDGFHLITSWEVEALKKVLGVYDPDRNYNLVIDGHGTGYAPPTEEDYSAMVGSLVVRNSTSGVMATEPRWDLSDDPHFPAVGDQGSVGSCSAWAMAYYCYGFLEAKDNDWTDASEGFCGHLMSPSWAYNKANGGTDGGSWMGDIGSILCTWGGATMATMPYDGRGYITSSYLDWGGEDAFREAPLHRGLSVESIEFNTVYWQGTVDQIRSVVRSGTPVCFILDASALEGPEGDMVISSVEYNYTVLNHAQTIVGYDDALVIDGDVGAFKVVNSWGADFWDNGFYWITYEALKKTSPENQLMYVTDREDYQPSLLGVWHYSASQRQDLWIDVSLQGGSAVVTPYYEHSVRNLPDFLCLDLTDLENDYRSGLNTFVLDSHSNLAGTCSSFRTEQYDDGYVPGRPTHVSEPSPDVPASPAEGVRSVLWHYDTADLSMASEAGGLYLASEGNAAWTATNYTSSIGPLSLQSGDVAQSHRSRLSLGLYGSGNLSFDWKMGSIYTSDSLVLQHNGVAIDTLTGATDWSHMTVEVGAGTHEFLWALERGGDGGGCAWVDNISWSGSGPQTDEEPPELTIVSPMDQSWQASSSVTVSWSGMDIGGISHYEISWDGGPMHNVSLETSASTDNLGAGAHNATVRAYDRAGNLAERSVTFYVDLDPPVITLTPSEGEVVGTSSVPITVHIIDQGSGEHNDTVRIDGRSVRIASNLETLSFFSELTDGSHVLNVTSVDGAGNRAYASHIFTVDGLPPELTITAPLGGSAQHLGDIYSSWTVYDTVAVVRVERSFDGGEWKNVTGQTYDMLYSLIDGEHNLTLRAFDLYGHVTVATITFIIDTTLPYAFLTDWENMPLNEAIVVRFSEPMDHRSLNWSTNFPATVAWSGEDLVVTPTMALEEATDYEIRLTANDLSGQGTGQVILPFSTMGMSTIYGRVVDSSGNPVYGALVTIGDVNVTSASDGTFRIDIMSGSYDLTIHVDGSEDAIFPVNVSAGQELNVGDRAIDIASPTLNWLVPAVIVVLAVTGVAIGTYAIVRRKKR